MNGFLKKCNKRIKIYGNFKFILNVNNNIFKIIIRLYKQLMKYITIKYRNDGFGAQFLNRIIAILYSEKHNCEYLHLPITSMEHNYNNNPDFIATAEKCMNLKDYYKSYDNQTDKLCSNIDMYKEFHDNIDEYVNSITMKKLKELFWKNKDRNIFVNEKINVAIHIRRPNRHDNRILGTDTPLSYYINIIKNIIEKYKDKDLLFHIYSQGNKNQFNIFENFNINYILHLDEDVFLTFTQLVASDILVISYSAFSYCAALLNDGTIYYIPMVHPPCSKWVISNT